MRQYLNCLLQNTRGENHKNRQYFEVIITSVLVLSERALNIDSGGGGIGGHSRAMQKINQES